MRSGGKRTGGWLIGLILAFALALPSSADEQRDNRRDHDRARLALEAGEILPLKTVLEMIARDTPGQVMEVELERKGERWVYEIKLLRAGGSLVKLKVDARDGTIIPRREYGTTTNR
ncbi:MAG: PepSY domain-containing protein [Propionivibrio sp.]|uniref:PepSY domain-containing protein n=1 Tax=Candidatus Propionivibrio dominans TaxID=2954373 RepID=A0A9D7FNV8_9RHOO|nr:PepSY domain-containing protein [Candidatus Propionivibrio dominans]MBL0168943.1 PepSY domain-containing protein [Propionivibrio sp.]